MKDKQGGNQGGADEVQIGRVIKPHGVRGEVVVDATTDDPNGRFAVGTGLVGKQTGRERELTVKAMRPHQGRLLVTFDEVRDRNEAESLRGMRFFAPPVFDDEDAYYDHELVGLRVLNCGDVDEETANARAYDGAQPEPVDIGEVAEVLRNPAQRLLRVALDDGGDALVPFVGAMLPIVDLDTGAIVITTPEGLLDL
ncbi:ribosome maturation factor RimM [uncultured Corynebacterium sp.]|uniref:ribosome maturation factor RimM n=1 Tax=uncultured Corynebacterium sp. TaxID=159447 RepID=UPI00260F5400|nr:ribosome maturation factor RimM [uncultured Corynebacterium sp.]